MSTKYRNTLTVLTPESDWPAMNELAVMFGESGEPDRNSFTTVRFKRNGRGYAYMHTVCTDTVKDALQGPLPIPATVLMALDADSPPEYFGDTIIACNVDPQTILSAYGFAQVED